MKFEHEKIQAKVLCRMWSRVHSELQPVKVLPRMCRKRQKMFDGGQSQTLESSNERGNGNVRKINYKAKPYAVCGKNFIPRSGCAKYCPRCRPKILVAYATKSASNTKYKRYLEQVNCSSGSGESTAVGTIPMVQDQSESRGI